MLEDQMPEDLVFDGSMPDGSMPEGQCLITITSAAVRLLYPERTKVT